MGASRYGIYLQVFNLISHSFARYQVEHGKRYSISTSKHILFCLLFRHTDNDVFDFRRFPTNLLLSVSGSGSENCNLHETVITRIFFAL